MKPINRRKFLQLAGMGLGGLAFQQFLAACGIKPTSSSISPLPKSPTRTPFTDQPTETPQSPTDTDQQSTNTPENLPQPDLVVVHGNDPEQMVRQSIKAVGGISQFVSNGANVIIKPNICVGYHTYEYAATTNPWVVAALVRLCFEAGASRVRVMDNPFGGPAEQCYEISGIANEVMNAVGEMEVMQNLKFKKTPLPGGVKQNSLIMYQDILNADLVINVPIAKTHGSAGLTLGMKNMMGTIQKRELIHSDLGNSIVDLAMFVKPALTVIDAIRILTANGPTGGSLSDVKQTNTLIVSRDVVSADSFATSLFGKTPNDIGHIRKAIERGYASKPFDQLRIEEFSIS